MHSEQNKKVLFFLAHPLQEKVLEKQAISVLFRSDNEFLK